MSERYSRIFENKPNLYIEGAPVVIPAGVILKDNESGRIMAQLKFRNVSGKGIKNISVKITAMDGADRVLDAKIAHTYLDINIANGGEDGHKQPILLPRESRSFNVSVSEVVFEDKNVWTCENEQWNSLGETLKLGYYFGSFDLAAQYEIECDAATEYVPKKFSDIWLCTCGEYNRGSHCYKCGLSIDRMLEKLDKKFLEKNLEIRLKNEAYQEGIELFNRGKEFSSVEDVNSAIECFKKSEQDDWKEKVQQCETLIAELEAQHKRNVKIGAIVAGSFVALILLIVLCTEVIVPNVKYSKAKKLYNEGKFIESMAMYAELEDFRDSQTQYFEAKLGDARQMVANGQFEEGIEIMQEMTAAKERDCWGHINESIYAWGLSLMKEGNYDLAVEKFKNCGEVHDSLKYIPYCQALRLSEASVVERYNLFKDIRGFLDVDKQLAQIETIAEQAMALNGSFETVVGESKRKIKVENGEVVVYRYNDYWEEYRRYATCSVCYDKGTERFYYYWDYVNNYLIVDDVNNVTGQTQE